MPLSAILIAANSLSPAQTKITTAEFAPSGVLTTPLSGVDIFGRSILQRTVDALTLEGIRVTVIATPDCHFARKNRHVNLGVADCPSAVESGLNRAIQSSIRQGADTALIAQLGAYVEFELMDALKFHHQQHQAITPFHDGHSPLGYWLIDLTEKSITNKLDMLLNNMNLGNIVPYKVSGYVNRLRDAHDLRQLVVDAFLGNNSLTPQGRQLRPGIWVDDSACVHDDVRLVAPASVGCNARLERGTVVTRFSNLESGCRLGENSVVAYSSILSDTVIGPRLDLSNAVVDGAELIDLRRNVSLRIYDSKLIASRLTRSHAPAQAPHRGEESLSVPEQRFEYSHYLVRAAGRLLEAFRGEA